MLRPRCVVFCLGGENDPADKGVQAKAKVKAEKEEEKEKKRVSREEARVAKEAAVSPGFVAPRAVLTSRLSRTRRRRRRRPRRRRLMRRRRRRRRRRRP